MVECWGINPVENYAKIVIKEIRQYVTMYCFFEYFAKNTNERNGPIITRIGPRIFFNIGVTLERFHTEG